MNDLAVALAVKNRRKAPSELHVNPGYTKDEAGRTIRRPTDELAQERMAKGGIVGDSIYNDSDSGFHDDIMNPIDMGGDDDFTHAEINDDKGYNEKDSAPLVTKAAHGGLMTSDHIVSRILSGRKKEMPEAEDHFLTEDVKPDRKSVLHRIMGQMHAK